MTVTQNHTAYHHGELPAALRAATVELVAERGPVGFSLREVARRAGVSHAAPAHHFGDSRGLLTSVATEGFIDLCAAFEAALVGVDDPVDRLNAVGKAYVDVATNQVGHFAVMWSDKLIDTENPDLLAAGAKAYGYLEQTIAAIAEAHNPDLDIDAASTLAWSSVHGLAMLTCKTGGGPPMQPGLGEDDAEVQEVDLHTRVEQFTAFFLRGFVGA